MIALLVLFSLARGICSVAYKDVLGKTVPKTRRGTLMGYSAALAGIAAVAVGAWIKLGAGASEDAALFIGMLAGAGLLWLVAAGLFAGLRERPGATEGGGNAFAEAVKSLSLLRTDVLFRHFVTTRALLLSTALSMPFYVLLAREQTGSGIGALGLLLIASGLAGSLSAPVWGRLADRSARLVMVAGGLVAAGLGGAAFALTGPEAGWTPGELGFAALFLVMGIAHSGVRLGRKAYLVDMATAETRAAYVALSNTVIGALMLLGGLFGVLAQVLGARGVILVLAAVVLLAALSAWRLEEVE